MDREAAHRDLYAREADNGVTGFVAATGKSYLCEDTANDPLYLTGREGAKSSLTVPLKLHNEVIGTFNVESPQPHAFTDADLQFLQIFCRDVAVSLNTLQLLAAQRMNAAQESVEEIHRQVAVPIDEIVCDATFVTERLADVDPELRARLEKILGTARGIKDVIHKVGRTLAPTEAVPVARSRKAREAQGQAGAGRRWRRKDSLRRARPAGAARLRRRNGPARQRGRIALPPRPARPQLSCRDLRREAARHERL